MSLVCEMLVYFRTVVPLNHAFLRSLFASTVLVRTSSLPMMSQSVDVYSGWCQLLILDRGMPCGNRTSWQRLSGKRRAFKAMSQRLIYARGSTMQLLATMQTSPPRRCAPDYLHTIPRDAPCSLHPNTQSRHTPWVPRKYMSSTLGIKSPQGSDLPSSEESWC